MMDEIATRVEAACKAETNVFGAGIWPYHIVSVVKFGKHLAERMDADVEIVELAALLHDYAGIVNHEFEAEHHVHGARLAESILRAYDYPPERIQAVQHCILSHRASQTIARETIEAEIVASADAMAHFDNVPSLLHLAFARRGMGIEAGSQWVLGKLGRSWNKLLPEARVMLEAHYEAIQQVLN